MKNNNLNEQFDIKAVIQDNKKIIEIGDFLSKHKWKIVSGAGILATLKLLNPLEKQIISKAIHLKNLPNEITAFGTTCGLPLNGYWIVLGVVGVAAGIMLSHKLKENDEFKSKFINAGIHKVLIVGGIIAILFILL